MLKNIIILGLSILTVSCGKMNIYADYDSSVNFSGYKSFAWENIEKRSQVSKETSGKSLVEKHIISYTNKELVRRGYILDTVAPDIIISFKIARKNERNEFGNFFSNLLNSTITHWTPLYLNRNEGSLTITIIDRAKKQIIWEANADGAINDLSSNKNKLPKSIKSIFNNYPILSSNNPSKVDDSLNSLPDFSKNLGK
jgi:hypothetical protein